MSFLRRWVLTVTAAETVGFACPALAGTLVADQPAPVVLTTLVLAGGLEGAALGWGQATALRTELPALGLRAWTTATATAAGLAWLVGMGLSSYRAWTRWPTGAAVALVAAAAAVLLLSLGTAQWLVLRRHLARAWRWVPVTAVAWAAGLLVFTALTSPLWQPGQGPVLVAAIGVLGGVAMALTMASVSGVLLQWTLLTDPLVRRVVSR